MSGSLRAMHRICYYHAGCPDGFGAAWAVRRAWGDAARYQPRGHSDRLDAASHSGDEVLFVDIAPDNAQLRQLARFASRIVILDHHVTALERYRSEPSLAELLERVGHRIHFDLAHSGAVLAWQHCHPDRPTPAFLDYVEDQDLWNWKLPESEAVNAALGSYPRDFESWDRLAGLPIEQLAAEGRPILRSNQQEVERALQGAHTVRLGGERIEAVNARYQRAPIGHALATRALHGRAWGLVYRLRGDKVEASIYSLADFDVAAVAARYGGGGHRNAAGFTVDLDHWLRNFL